MKPYPPKFKTQFVSDEIPTDPRISELRYWCNEFHRHSLAPEEKGMSYGNLSFRQAGDGFIITASSLQMKKDLRGDCFVKVPFVDMGSSTVYASGIREPSSESMLHFAIYQQRKDVNAIFHGHSKEILMLGSTIYIPETKTEEPYGTKGLVDRVLEILDSNSFIIMKNHGFLSLANNMRTAGELAVNIQTHCLMRSLTF